MARRRNACSAAITLLLLSPLIVAAEEYRNEAWRFSLTAPPNLTRMNPEQLKKFQDVADRQPTRRIVYVAGFRADPGTPGTPYVLIHVQKADMSRVTYTALETQLSSEFEKRFAPADETFDDLVKELDLNDAAVDGRKHRFTFVGSMKTPNGRNVEMATAAMFGARGIVTMNCYATGGRMKQLLRGYKMMFDSFRFDAGFEFKEEASVSREIAKSILGGSGRAELIAVAAVATAVLILVLRAAFAKK